MSVDSHIQEHIGLGLPFRGKTIGSTFYAGETFPSVLSTTISPHLIGFWPLNLATPWLGIRDISGNGNHIARSTRASPFSSWIVSSGFLGGAAGNGFDGRICANPVDTRFDIGNPGASFVAAWQTRVDSVAGGKDQTVLSKGSNNSGAPAGASGIVLGMIDRIVSVPRMRLVLSNTNYYSSDFPAWSAGAIYHIAVVRDAGGSMGTANRIYVYINGVRDTAFNAGAGFVAYAPTAQYNNANLSFGGYGNNVTGLDYANSAANGYALANLQLAVLAQSALPGSGTPTSMDTLIATMAASPTRILTAGDIP